MVRMHIKCSAVSVVVKNLLVGWLVCIVLMNTHRTARLFLTAASYSSNVSVHSLIFVTFLLIIGYAINFVIIVAYRPQADFFKFRLAGKKFF